MRSKSRADLTIATSRSGPEAGAKPCTAFTPSVADMLIVTLGLFAGLASYFAKPCSPEQWALVKAARSSSDSIPTSSRNADRVPDSVPPAVPAFERDLAGLPA